MNYKYDNGSNASGVVALVFGILSLIFFPIIFGIIAIVAGFYGEEKINTAGAIMGFIGLGFGVFRACVMIM